MAIIQNTVFINFLLSTSKILFWFSIVFSFSFMPCLFYGAFGNEVNLKVDVYSGNIVWEKMVDYSGTKPVFADVTRSLNQPSIPLVKDVRQGLDSSKELNEISLAQLNLINVIPTNKAKYHVFHLLPPFDRVLILFSSLLTLLCFVLITNCFKKFIKQIASNNYFVLETINYLRQLSYLLFLLWIIEFGSTFILVPFRFANLPSISYISVVLDFPSVSLLFLGSVFFVLAHVFSHGILLKEDLKLII